MGGQPFDSLPSPVFRPPMGETTEQRLRAIDGLRAVAALGVFGGHALPMVFPSGGSGVDVFFVLSGYLITGILVRMSLGDGTIRLGEFYRRRALRIWPALLLLLLLLGTIFAATGNRGGLFDVAAAATATMNIARAFGITSGGALGHTWTLAVEEQFYLLWPLLLAFTPWLKRPQQFVLGLLAVFVVASFVRSLALLQWPLDDFHSDGLILGCILAIWRPAWLNRLSAYWPAALVALVALLLVPAGAKTLFYYWVNVAAALLAACLVVAAAEGRRMPPLELAPLVWLGQRSYGFYLWHFPIIGIANQTGLAPGLRVPLAFVLTMLVAALSYRFVEQPIRRYGLDRARAPKVAGQIS